MSTRRQPPLPPPSNMIFLREALQEAPLSRNQAGDLVRVASMRRSRMGGTEEFIVTWRASSTSFFQRRWNDALGDEGDWEMVSALSTPDLDDLYATASVEQRKVLDAQRWNPDSLRWHAK